MKIAYLIAASGDYGHLRRLVDALDDGHARIFVHIDAKSPMPDTLADSGNVTFVPRIKVWWAGFSQVAATLAMMRRAVDDGYDYYAFLSGGDYPIRPNGFLQKTLADGGEFIDAHEGFGEHKPEKRLKYYYFDCFDRRANTLKSHLLRGIERLAQPFARKRHYPFARVWHGASWWVLSDRCVRYILDYVDRHPEYVSFYRTALSPDESFFQTIVGNSPLRDEVRGNLTYTDWSGGQTGPAFISGHHLPALAPGHTGQQPEPFFARKFDDSSTDVVRRIDELYRQP